jgi:hypothetical protein
LLQGEETSGPRGFEPGSSAWEARDLGFKSHPRTLSCTLEFFGYLRRRVRETTVESYCTRVKVLSKLGDLDNPENLKNNPHWINAYEEFVNNNIGIKIIK